MFMHPSTLIAGNFNQWTSRPNKSQGENMEVKQHCRSNIPNISTEYSTETTENTHS